jgi:hypothetical protein
MARYTTTLGSMSKSMVAAFTRVSSPSTLVFMISLWTPTDPVPAGTTCPRIKFGVMP